MMNMVRDMARHDMVYRRLFGGDMEKLLASRKRSPRNRKREDVALLPGGATPVTPSGVNCTRHGFFRIRPGEVSPEFRDGDPSYGLISECELAVLAVCMVAWAKQSSRQAPLVGSDNMNAAEWASGGKAKQRTAMEALYCLIWY